MDACAKFGGSRLKPSRRHFGRFSNVDNFRPEECSDVISGVGADPRGAKFCVKLGQTVLEIYHCITLLRTTITMTQADGAHGNTAKRRLAALCLNSSEAASCLETSDYNDGPRGRYDSPKKLLI